MSIKNDSMVLYTQITLAGGIMPVSYLPNKAKKVVWRTDLKQDTPGSVVEDSKVGS